ncbi:MAG: DUF2059 domain-containing protein [Candidatus Eremiobacteraeota bacterium]|nr:DUF2059 domain-containing protein [Candidatus Eremiobacteraeota bacterium]
MLKRTVQIILLILSLFFTAHCVRAQEDNPSKKTPQNTKVTNRKRKLIMELLEITRVNESIMNFFDRHIKSGEKGFQKSVKKLYQDLKIKEFRTPKEEKIFTQHLAGIIAEFRKKTKMDFDKEKVLEEIYIRAYSKYFSEEDLENIIKFYKTPSGQKLLKHQGDIRQEASELSRLILVPRILNLISKILQEEEQMLIEALEKKREKKEEDESKNIEKTP